MPVLARRLGSRPIKFERTMLAGFLVAMPLVYVMGWFAARDHAARWNMQELARANKGLLFLLNHSPTGCQRSSAQRWLERNGLQPASTLN